MTPQHAPEHRRPAWRLAIAAALLACGTLAHPAPTTTVPSALTRLGERAIATFERQLEPAPIMVTLDGWAEREAGVIERAQLRRVYAAAVQALIVQAGDTGSNGDRVVEIRNALEELARQGRSLAADRLFAAQAEAEQARGGEGRAAAALAWRHSVALSELPVALAARSGHGDSRQVFRGRTFQALGTLALPTLERAAHLDGSDPWAWIMLSWLGSQDAALPAALEVATGSADDTTALAAALPLLDHWRRERRGPDVAALYLATLQRMEQGAKRQPTDIADVQRYAFALHRAAEFESRIGRPQMAWKLMQSVLRLREKLAADAQGETQRQWDLIATHNTMAHLPHESGGENHMSSAMALAAALNQRERFTPMLDGNALSGMAGVVLRLAGGLTLLIGIGLLVLYRWRIARWMRAAAASSRAMAAPPRAARLVAPTETAPSPALRPIADSAAGHIPRSPAMAAAASGLRRAGVVQSVAGIAFGLVAAFLYYRLGNLIFRPWGFAITVWAWTMPALVVLWLLWAGDRKRQWTMLGLYAAVVVLFCTRVGFSSTPPFTIDSRTLFPLPITLLLSAVTPISTWLPPSLILPPWSQPLFTLWMQAHELLPALLFLSRRVRAAAPVLVLLLFVLCAGGVLSSVAFSTWVGIQLQSRLAMAGLPFAVFPLAQFLLGALLALPFAWLLGQGLAKAHRAQWTSDQSLVFDAIWLLQTLLLLSALVNDAGAEGLFAFMAFGAYKSVSLLGMRSVTRAARSRPPARLLLLRVFGQRQRSEALLDVLAARWRYAGPIQMIGAPDVATRTVDPDEFMDFVSGRLRRQFVIEPQDLPRRIADIKLQPDGDGRFRINDVFCGNDTWQAAVRALMSASELCLMDLRGFSETNSGCIIELQALLDIVPTHRIVLLIDASTDRALLERTLSACHSQLTDDSVNAGAMMTPLATLDARGSDLDSVRRLLTAADRLLVLAVQPASPRDPASESPPRGMGPLDQARQPGPQPPPRWV